MRFVLTDGHQVLELDMPHAMSEEAPLAPSNELAVPVEDGSPEPADVVDLRVCKAEATRLLPPGNPIREALLREPDEMPRREAGPRLETYFRLLVASRGPR